MNSINVPKTKYDDRYDRMVNNIIYEGFPQDICPGCNSTICNCNNKNAYKNHKSKKYNSFNTDIERRYQSIKNNKNIINLNKMKIKPIQIPLFNYNNKQSNIAPSTTRDFPKKSLKNNFKFYNNNEAQTIHNNYFDKLRIDSYSNIHQNDDYSNQNPLINYKRLNNSVSGKLVIPYFNNIRNINSNYDTNYNYMSPKNSSEDFLTINKSNKYNILHYNNIFLEKEKKNKFRKIFNINEEKNMNRTLEKPTYGSYVNIHQKPLNNNNNTINNNLDSISPINKSKYTNKIKKHIYFKKSNNSQTNNLHSTYFNNINFNINNNYNYSINENNIINIPQNSIEQINKYNSSNIEDDNKKKNESNNIIRLKRKHITLNKKYNVNKRERMLERYINSNYKTKNPINQIYHNNIKNSKNVENKNYFSNKTEFLDENKENKSNNNIIEDSLVKEKNISRQINIKLFEEMKNNYSTKVKKNYSYYEIPKGQNINSKFSKFILDRQNNNIEDIHHNTDIETNKYKLKTLELISLLKKANNEIFQLKSKLHYFNKLNNRKNTMKNYKKLNSAQLCSNNLKRYIKSNCSKKSSLKIKIGARNFNSQINNKYNANLNSENSINESNPLNSQNLKLQTNLTFLNTSNNKIIINNNYNNINNNKNQHKYIFTIYNPKNKNCKNSILCFDAETKSFEIKNLSNSNNFHKNFFDSMNKENKISNSLYLINNNNYYIVTGLNCNKFYKYNYKENKISRFNDLKYNHINGAMIAYNDKIICLSGDLNKKVEIFSENENVWLKFPEMQIERSHFAICLIKNRYLFTFFGYNYPNRTYLNSIEYLDLLIYNNNNENNIQNEKFYWRYLDYKYFSTDLSFQKINLIGSVAINYKDEKIIFFGGKNYLVEDDDEGYYQLIIDDTYINTDELDSYIEKIKIKEKINFNKNYYFNNYKYIEELNNDNILKEPSFISFDNNYNVHLIKLDTMNHEVYNITQ